MTDASTPQAFAESLTDADYEELDRFLCSDATGDAVMMIDTLDGYLTAIALGPKALPVHAWLPGVWGGKEEDAPKFASEQQAQRIHDLILRQMNGIVWSLEANPDAYEPILDTVSYGDKTKEYLDGEMWCYGFMAGVALTRDAWQPLFELEEGVQALLPIYLLGADDPTPKQKALTQTPAQRERLAEQITPSVGKLFRFWQPYRQAMHERMVATTIQRTSPKVGRNDPCPCGSGKKFKKCCGAASELH
ncbi:MAG TPA: UPF0149 family protein [Rhodocyclaceae bacterium]